MHTWWLKIAFVWEVSMCINFMCAFPLRLLITSLLLWHDIDTIRLVKQVQLFYLAAIVGIVSIGVSICVNETHCRNQPNKSKLALLL